MQLPSSADDMMGTSKPLQDTLKILSCNAEPKYFYLLVVFMNSNTGSIVRLDCACDYGQKVTSHRATYFYAVLFKLPW